jgi:Zn-dependent metalloprotease
MAMQRNAHRTITGLRRRAAFWAACGATAVLAIGVALAAMTALILVLGVLGSNILAPVPHTLGAAVQDAAAAFYLAQLVGVSFFRGTAELRFAAIPGLFVIGLSITVATAFAARLIRGDARHKMRVALAIAVPYALLAGIGALLVPLEITAPSLGSGIAVHPSVFEAFLFPLGWGLLFGSIGGLLGVFGRDWRHGARRALGSWATPLAAALPILLAALVASAAISVVGVLSLTGWDLDWLTAGGLGRVAATLGAAVLALPSLAAAVLLSGLGMPFNWRLDALSESHGSLSVLHGALPAGAGHGHAAPAVLTLAPIVALATVVAIGLLAARRSGPDARRGLGNGLRAAALTTLGLWLLGLLARVDVQAGGLLGVHLAPDLGALLWRAPLAAFAGCLAGSVAYLLGQGSAARAQLAAIIREAAHPWRRHPSSRFGFTGGIGRGLAWRAMLGVGFAAIPVALAGMGPAGTITSAAPPAKVSLAPIAHEAEQTLEEDNAPGHEVELTVNPTSRVLGTATLHTPLHALGISPSAPSASKAKAVLDEYGELFGIEEPAEELGHAEATTNELGGTNVDFTQTADSLPVFGARIGVTLAPSTGAVTFISGSTIPDVAVADDETKLSSSAAVAIAKQALPGGTLARPADLQVYAGIGSYVSGPHARLAWLVWLIDNERHVSTEYVVDAVDGKILDALPKADFALKREVYDAKETSGTGKIARVEGQAPTGNEDVDNAYEYTGDVYHYYEQLERNSYDNQGATLVSVVHEAEPSGTPLQNAYWNGQRMVFGLHYASALDVVGHELTHAVTEHTSGLLESGQSGALNESFSDMMGATIEIEQDEAEGKALSFEHAWEIGESLPGGAIRSLAEPKKFKELSGAGDEHADPEKLSEWDPTCLDNLGVHINSTITSHAYYLVAQDLGLEVAKTVFYRAFTELLKPNANLESARAAVLAIAEEYFPKSSTEWKTIEADFTKVGLNGTALPPASPCEAQYECSYARALKDQAGADGSSTTLEMLETLYRARGELAQTSASGAHFLPLYEAHMGRITELVSEDPELEQIATEGMQELTPALEGLIEGEGSKFELSTELMGRIEAALRRLAQDDRIYEGPESGALADLIEEELEWMGMRSYGGMNYAAGFSRLNGEVETHAMLVETGKLVDPNCTGRPYSNQFAVNGFFVNTPGREVPGQVAGLTAGGVICGATVEKAGPKEECRGKASLNTNVKVTLPPGDKVNSSKNLPSGSWVGEAIGRAIGCAGAESRVVYGQAGLLSLASWTVSQCPTAAIACYEGRSTYTTEEGPTVGRSYAWVMEEGGALQLTTSPVQFTADGIEVPVSLGQFEVRLCARAGSAAEQKCGGETATWVHQNGEAAEPGCPTTKGRYLAKGVDTGGTNTAAVESCISWDREAHMQTLSSGKSINSVSCIPGTTDCVASDSSGNAYYSTNVSATAPATWTSWTGAGVSPSEGIDCPTTTLCMLAAGAVEGGGGNAYHAASLGGAFSTSFLPSYGVNAISCPTASFCVSAQYGGYVRYSAKPSGLTWTAVAIGSGGMKGVSCLSAAFCAVVDDSGNLHVANTEAHVKEAAGWKATDIDGAKALDAISCASTTTCYAVDGGTEVLKLAIETTGAATVTKHAVAGASALDAITCEGSNCVAADEDGGVFTSFDGGSTWSERLDSGAKAKSVSCSSVWLCAAVTGGGEVAAFNPSENAPSRTQTIDTGNSLTGATCLAATVDCVVVDNKGKALYSTGVSLTAAATWTSWSGPTGQSPAQAISCPTTSLCVLADGKEASGGNLYYASSLGGTFTSALSPTSGVDAISCPSASFCLAGENKFGRFAYSSTPGSTSWEQKELGPTEATALRSVSCLSSAFCAAADSRGRVHVATKAEAVASSTWTETDVDASNVLNGISCASATSCFAVDANGNVLKLTISGTGAATTVAKDIDGTHALTGIACTTGSTCVAIDGLGNVFVTNDAGVTWGERLDLGAALTAVACASNALCVATDNEGKATAFDAR